MLLVYLLGLGYLIAVLVGLNWGRFAAALSTLTETDNDAEKTSH